LKDPSFYLVVTVRVWRLFGLYDVLCTGM